MVKNKKVLNIPINLFKQKYCFKVSNKYLKKGIWV